MKDGLWIPGSKLYFFGFFIVAILIGILGSSPGKESLMDLFIIGYFLLGMVMLYEGLRGYLINENGIEARIFNKCVKKYTWDMFDKIGVVISARDNPLIRCCGGRYGYRSVGFTYTNERWNEFIKYAPMGKINEPPSEELIKSYTPVSPDWRMTEEEKAEAHAKEAEERTKKDQRK